MIFPDNLSYFYVTQCTAFYIACIHMSIYYPDKAYEKNENIMSGWNTSEDLKPTLEDA